MMPILIAGGGIAGLTTAIALARHGIASRVFEARTEPPREGAGIQLGPNATRLLEALGLAKPLAPAAVTPHCIIVNDGVSGREVTRLPLGEWMTRRHRAPYWVVHRAALHDVLLAAAQCEPRITIETGRRIAQISEGSAFDLINVNFDDGGEAEGAALIGADGIWSCVRNHVNPEFKLKYAGVSAARAVVPRDPSLMLFGELVTGVWLAPDSHIVHYPIDGGANMAIVAIGKCAEPGDGWNSAVDNGEIAARFQRMSRSIRSVLDLADTWRQWPLYETVNGGNWSKGQIVLIGDAAHPILPFLAQGGAMAIEDGYEIAAAIAGNVNHGRVSLTDFWRGRRRRVERVQAASAQNGRAYHLDGAGALARNIALRSLPGAMFMQRYDWIYGYDTNR
jgi:salicylate hydroxylase